MRDDRVSAPGDLESHTAPDTDDMTEASAEQVRRRAAELLREGRFKLADALLEQGDQNLASLLENQRIYQAELEIQNEELQRGQHQIQEALARFSAFFNSLPVAELVINRKGLVLEANPAAQSLFGLAGNHLRQHFFARLIEESDRAAVIDAWSNLHADHGLELPETRFRSGRQGGFIGDLHIAPLRTSLGEIEQYVCAVIDRTDSVAQRCALDESSARLRRSESKLRERLKELSALHDILAETSRLEAPVEEVLQRVVERLRWACRFSDIAEARIRLPDGDVQTAGFVETAWERRVDLVLPDSTRGDIRLVYRERPPLVDEDVPFLDEELRLLDAVAAHIEGFLGRRYDERRLRETRERYRVLAEFSSEWEYWLGPHGRYLYVSPACERITGYAAAAFESDSSLLFRLIHPDDRTLWEAKRARLEFDHGATQDGFEFRLLARDGSERWIEQIFNPVFNDTGDFLGWRGVNRDITEHKRAEEALKRSEAFLNATGRMAKIGGWELDPASQEMRWTRGTYELFALPEGSALSVDRCLEQFHPKDAAVLCAALDRASNEGIAFDLSVRLDASSDSQRWLQITCQPLQYAGSVVRLLGAIQDITARVEAEKALRQAARVFESTAEGVIITDPEARILAVNRAFTEITGYSEAEALGGTPKLLRSGRQGDDFYDRMWRGLSDRGHWRGELWDRNKNGEIFPVLLTLSSVLDDAGELTHYVGVFSDISHIKRAEERLEFLANHDPLTELPNRALFQKRLSECIQRAERYQRQFALLFIDLDRFKDINDTLGHLFGDALLKQVAAILGHQVRSVDTIARLGGDEFVIVLEDIPAPRFAARFADRLMEIFAQPLSVESQELFITASIGISLYPQDGCDIESLVRHADIAMYQAKNAGRNAFSFFEPLMSEGVAQRLKLEHELRGALNREEFVLHYQPQLTLDGRRLRGVEILCRWRHPELGLLPPERFLPMTEELGLIDALGYWILEQGCRQLAHWDKSGVKVPRLAMNLSVRELSNEDLVPRIRETLEHYGIAPERLELEVAESKLVRCSEASLANLSALSAMGVTLAIDDFGVASPALASLQRLPLKRLKIDRSIVDSLAADSGGRILVRAISGLARGLGLEIFAEGVETAEQADILRLEGCDEGQGFFFCHPLPPKDLHLVWPL